MAKLVVLVKRAQNVSLQELQTYWEDVHIPEVIKSVAPDYYRVTVFDPDAFASTQFQPGTDGVTVVADEDGPRFDGMEVLCFDDEARAEEVKKRIVAGTWTNDNFSEYTDPPYALLDCVETVVVEGEIPDNPVKAIGIAWAKEGYTNKQVQDCWFTDHAEPVGKHLRDTEGGIRYTVSIAAQDEVNTEFAGFAEAWYVDEAAQQAHSEKVGPDHFQDIRDAYVFAGREIVGTG